MKKLLFISLIVLTFACKNKKEVVETSSKTDVILQENEAVLDMPESEGELWLKKVNKGLPDSLVVRIQRTACFGRCPIYTTEIFKGGTIFYTGEKWVEREGHFVGKISQEYIEGILAEAKKINYLELNSIYDHKGITDLPSTITSIRVGGQLKSIVNRYQAPELLNEFERFIDSQYQEVEWKLAD